MNRLAHERSPYLLQHAHNPVDWYPWGDDAFARARAEDKPIFLSIGYSTCHWCHVMERESFEKDEVAAVLNDGFVSIKVDREERPDVDRVYMTFVQATTGSGGWPMSVWLTPDLKPFYGGTYFPPFSRWGRPGFVDILHEIGRIWRTDRSKVVESAEALTDRLRSMDRAGTPAPGVPGAEALERTVYQFRQSFDARHGGFGDAPKFPRPSELLFLMREYARMGDEGARRMAIQTLTAIAQGGMCDHIGGGFHRYSVDGAWRVPHFEKMLYDQAQLALAFTEAAQVTGDRFFSEVVDDTLQYVSREMTDPDGGFYSAEDADSVPAGETEKKEGAFYLWADAEIAAVVDGDAPLVRRRFGIEVGGNAPFDPQQEFTGKNLLYVAASVDRLSEDLKLSREVVLQRLNAARMKMFAERLKRPRPYRDDKILVAWNGLMIAAFARAARVFDVPVYLDAALKAARFIRERMQTAQGLLLRRYRGGVAEIDAYAEDYACLIFGLLELLQSTGDVEWLEWAIALQRRQDELFWDEAEGGWFGTTGRDPSVLLRMKEDYDGAEPTASSISVLNLLVLSHMVDDPAWNERVERTFRLFGVRLEEMGRAVPMMGAALSTAIAGIRQIVISGDDRTALERVIERRYDPFAIVIAVDGRRRSALARLVPAVAGMAPLDGQSAAYVCKGFVCRQPVSTPEALERELDG